MGLFSKLFSKKDKDTETNTEKPAEKKEERISFESPHGSWIYSASPVNNEYGYECEIYWHEDDEVPMCVFIETESPDNTDHRLCYERFERIYADRFSAEEDAKNIISDFILSHLDLFPSADDCSKEKLNSYMDLTWLGIRRNGDIEWSFDGCIQADYLHLLIREDGSKKLEYEDMDERCHKEFEI